MVRFDSKLNPYSEGPMGPLLISQEGASARDYRAFELAWYNQRLVRSDQHFYF